MQVKGHCLQMSVDAQSKILTKERLTKFATICWKNSIWQVLNESQPAIISTITYYGIFSFRATGASYHKLLNHVKCLQITNWLQYFAKMSVGSYYGHLNLFPFRKIDNQWDTICYKISKHRLGLPNTYLRVAYWWYYKYLPKKAIRLFHNFRISSERNVKSVFVDASIDLMKT